MCLIGAIIKKRSRAQERSQPAQIEAIEHCIERGKLAGANERLKRPACEIAWEWCAASPNISPAFLVLAESTGGAPGRYP